MTETITINRIGRDPSRIIVGDCLDRLDELLPPNRVIVITDSNLHRNYRDLIERFDHIIIGMGETNKTLITVERIYNQLIERGIDRESFILGFGGGIVTDIAGFVASTYMRGIRFGFVATTLLSQVDASVGGKNGVNVEGFKNMVGTFNQPDFVLCDSALLKTLPPQEFTSGLAEVIKAGIINDPALFNLFETYDLPTLKEDKELLKKTVTAAIRVKADIVERDEKEAGERKKLNLGHTFAHAIEKSTDKYNHGEAVAIGIIMAAELALKLELISESEVDRIGSVIKKMGLPTESGIDIKRILKAMRMDKKRDAESVNLVLPTSIGSCSIEKIRFDELEALLCQ